MSASTWHRLISPSALALAFSMFAAHDTLVAQDTVLVSGTFVHEQLTARPGETTKIREMLRGLTHSGYRIDLHTTELAPGQMPHAPHRHVHEEMVMLQAGTLEVTIAGKVQRVGPGSSVYVASNVEHGWRNVGTSPALYFVLALGTDEPAKQSAAASAPRPPGGTR